jgi:flavin reductase (DIM6/NTAB) family NADH-FMN oxidoreductase RutF
MFIDPTDTNAFRASLLNAIVAPRPIGWISTVAVDGVPNLAPFSYFNAISATPPIVLFAANAPADRHEKDTLANVRVVPEFVANFANYALREALNQSSAPAPHGVSEFGIAGLTPAASARVRPPRVAEAAVNLECRVMQIVDLPPQGPVERHCAVVIGRVVGVQIADGLLDADGRFNTAAAAPIARLGGFDYATLGEIFEMARPAWPPEDKEA